MGEFGSIHGASFTQRVLESYARVLDKKLNQSRAALEVTQSMRK